MLCFVPGARPTEEPERRRGHHWAPISIAQGILAKPHFERRDTKIVPGFDEVDYQKWLGTYRDVPEDVIDHLAKNADRNAFIAAVRSSAARQTLSSSRSSTNGSRRSAGRSTTSLRKDRPTKMSASP
jgi:hypothetical protein